MSFIYDDQNLIDQLLGHGLDSEFKLSKRAQAVNQDYAIVRSLIDSLQQQLPHVGDPSAPAISHEENATGAAPRLTSINLESLGALVDFLATGKITIDGQRIAHHLNEDPQDDSYQLYRLEPNAGLLEVQDRTKVERGFFVNKDLLNKYIVSLQAQMQKTPNPVMDVQLRKIIQQANTMLEAGLSEQYKEPAKPVLPDDTVLDYLPEVLNSDPKYAIVPGHIPLTYGDIKDSTTLNAWINKNKIGLKSGEASLGVNHPRFDHCAVLRVLHTRARYGIARASNQAAKDNALAYSQQVEKLAPSVVGPDGQACSLAEPSATAPTGKPGEAGAGAVAITPQIAAKIASTLPFSVRDINLDRITKFFETVAPLLTSNGQAMQNINAVQGMIRDLNGRYIRDRIIPLGQNLRQFANMLVDQQTPGKQVFPALTLLDQILDGTRNVVEALYSTYATQFQGINPAYIAYILGQIGRNPEDSSIYSRNSDDLENLRTSGKVT